MNQEWMRTIIHKYKDAHYDDIRYVYDSKRDTRMTCSKCMTRINDFYFVKLLSSSRLKFLA